MALADTRSAGTARRPARSRGTTIGPARPRIPTSAPARRAIGTSTSAPSAIRAKTMKTGVRPSSRPTLMNRYDAPQSAARSDMSSHERRFTGRLRLVVEPGPPRLKRSQRPAEGVCICIDRREPISRPAPVDQLDRLPTSEPLHEPQRTRAERHGRTERAQRARHHRRPGIARAGAFERARAVLARAAARSRPARRDRRQVHRRDEERQPARSPPIASSAGRAAAAAASRASTGER